MKKTCTHCKQPKDVSEFYKHPTTRDRLTSWCKDCTKKKQPRRFDPVEVTLLPPDVEVDHHANLVWVEHYLNEWTCAKCRSGAGLNLYQNGELVQPSTLASMSLERLKGQIDQYEVWCGECIERGRWSTLSTLFRENRKRLVPERAANADAAFSIDPRSRIAAQTAETGSGGFVVDTKAAILDKVKDRLACGICGESAVECLEFHHLAPSEKIAEVTAMARNLTPLATFLDEVQKCAIVCANCHRKLHAKTESKTNLLPIRLSWRN